MKNTKNTENTLPKTMYRGSYLNFQIDTFDIVSETEKTLTFSRNGNIQEKTPKKTTIYFWSDTREKVIEELKRQLEYEIENLQSQINYKQQIINKLC